MKKLLLVLMLTIITIAGCAANKDNDGNNENLSQLSQNPQQLSANRGEAKPDEKEYIKPEMKGEISISVLDDNEILNTAADLFMAKYPDVKLTINTFRKVETIALENGSVMSGTPSEEFSTENYLSQLNTKIMTGKAEDIILTGPIPFKKYTDMGAFEELSLLLEHSPEINEESHFMKVFELMKDKSGKLYEIPLTWNPPQIIFFDKPLVEDSKLFLDDSVKTMSYEAGLEYGKKLADSTNKENTFLEMGNSALHTAFSLMYDDFEAFVDLDNKKVNINNERFINILKRAKALEEQGYYDTEGKIDFYNMEYHFAYSYDFGVQAAFYALTPDSDRYHSMPMSDAKGNISMSTYPCFGINSASKNKELAWEFLKFLLSDEVQTSPSLYGLGVNKKGFNAVVERNLKMYNDGGNLNVNKEDYENLIISWMDQINYFEHGDSTVTNDFIFQEIRKFFKGEQPAEETAKILQSKLDKYFNE